MGGFNERFSRAADDVIERARPMSAFGDKADIPINGCDVR